MAQDVMILMGEISIMRAIERGYTVKNAVELLGAFRPDVEKIQYH